MDDLVDRLDNEAQSPTGPTERNSTTRQLHREAAAEIRRLREELEMTEIELAEYQRLDSENGQTEQQLRVKRAACDRLGSWMAAALDDPNVCAEMKADITAWFAALGQKEAADE